MNRFLLAVLFVFAFSACKQNARTVLVSGDSWGFFVCTYKSLDTALKSAGFTDVGSNSTCAITTRTGIRATNWTPSAFHKSTKIALQDPSVKVMFLSLGGNDLMNYWKKSMTPAEEQALFVWVKDTVAGILAEYKKIRPDVKFIVSGYDYPHFTADHIVEAYRETFEKMGSPTPYELNSMLTRFSKVMSELSSGQEVAYIQHLGLMHYYYGHKEGNLAPFITLSPEQISPRNNPAQYGGDLNLQTDVTGMLHNTPTGLVDAFHLSRQGYEKLADHVVAMYLKDWLTPVSPTK